VTECDIAAKWEQPYYPWSCNNGTYPFFVVFHFSLANILSAAKKIFQAVASQELKLRPFDTLWNTFEKTGYLVYIFNNAITGACVAPPSAKAARASPSCSLCSQHRFPRAT
jgi:hypothetical protein